MLQLYRFFRDEKGLEQTDIYYQAHVIYMKSSKHRTKDILSCIITLFCEMVRVKMPQQSKIFNRQRNVKRIKIFSCNSRADVLKYISKMWMSCL